jgi:hypothetical protein
MDMLEKAVKDPADRWRALREMLRIQRGSRSNNTGKKRGRPKKKVQAVK